MTAKEKTTNKGQLPPFVTVDEDWLFEISWAGECLCFETRWSPNIEVIRQIADHFGVGFTHGYIETGNQIFGEATYENGVLTNVALEQEDFDRFAFDDETDTYTFEKETYESDLEIQELLLERKKQVSENPDPIN